MWKSLLKQKMSLVCFKNGSDEIAGISVTYVKCEGERFWDELDQKVIRKIDLKFILQHFPYCYSG